MKKPAARATPGRPTAKLSTPLSELDYAIMSGRFRCRTTVKPAALAERRAGLREACKENEEWDEKAALRALELANRVGQTPGAPKRASPLPRRPG
jgi:hypothetical protein